MNCSHFKRSLYHFQADELPHEARESCEEHLTACPPCARLHEVEAGLLRGLKAKMVRCEAPPGLETRIRATLQDAGAGRSGSAAWLRSPWFAAVAASLLLAVMVFPSSDLYRTSSAVRVSEVVTLVDRACDLAGRTHQEQRSCSHPKHLNALRLANGRYWDLSLDHDESRQLVTDRETRGTRMRVEGLLYERIHTLQLETAEPIGPASVRLAFH